MLKSKKFYLIGLVALIVLIAIVAIFSPKQQVEVPEETTVATEELIPEATTIEDRFFNRDNNFDKEIKRIYKIGEKASAGSHNICVNSINKDSSLDKDVITCKFTLEKRFEGNSTDRLDEMFKVYVNGNLAEIDKEASSLENGTIVCSVEKDWDKLEVQFKSSDRSRRVIVYEFENTKE